MSDRLRLGVRVGEEDAAAIEALRAFAGILARLRAGVDCSGGARLSVGRDAGSREVPS